MASESHGEDSAPGADRHQVEGEDALWVRSFLRTESGKIYRVESTDDAREEAAIEAVSAAAHALTAEVARGPQGVGPVHNAVPDQPF